MYNNNVYRGKKEITIDFNPNTDYKKLLLNLRAFSGGGGGGNRILL